MFNLTVRILRETEERVLAFRPTPPILSGVLRTVMFPFPFMQAGIAELARPMVTWVIICIAAMTAVSLSIPHLELPAQVQSSIYMICIYLPMCMVAFAVPSTFGFDSIKDTQVQALADFIHSLGIDSEKKIEALEDSLEIVAERAAARTKSLQWMVATVWALFLYGFNQVNSIILRVSPEKITEILSESITTFVGYGVVSLLSILAIVGYKKGNDAVFRRLQFAIQELKYRASLR